MIISQTPLRISFLGGGTDFESYYKNHAGLVVSAAIDKYIFVIIKERFDSLIVLNYSKKEIRNSVEEIEHEFVREAMMKTGIKEGVEITMIADIPSEGSGLGSSSSVVVGLLNAMYAYTGKQVTAEQLAKEACDIEIKKCKKPIGKQDQYIAAYGGLCSIKFNKTGKVNVDKIEISEREIYNLSSNLFLYYTGVTRKSADVLEGLKSNISAKKNISDLNEIKKLAVEAKSAIEAGNIDKLGNLLNQNWKHKKKLSEGISNQFLDDMYSKAIKAGASGGKIAGAGGGGFFLLYCKKQFHDALKKQMKDFKEMPFHVEKDGSKIIFNYRRYSWK